MAQLTGPAKMVGAADSLVAVEPTGAAGPGGTGEPGCALESAVVRKLSNVSESAVVAEPIGWAGSVGMAMPGCALESAVVREPGDASESAAVTDPASAAKSAATVTSHNAPSTSHAHEPDSDSETATPTLIGVGVGPGDPELLTLQAVRILREADVVFAPTTSLDKTSRAEEIVLAATGAAVRRLVFALDDTGGVTSRRESAWDAAGRAVLAAFDAGAGTIAFATLGDPNVYSTFAYLAETVTTLRADVLVRTAAGITAMQDLAARLALPLAQGREPLTLLPATAGADVVGRALAGPGTVVVYKGGRHLAELAAAVDSADRGACSVLGTDLGLPTERIALLHPARSSADPARAAVASAADPMRSAADPATAAADPIPPAPYFTTLIAPPPPRRGRGGAL